MQSDGNPPMYMMLSLQFSIFPCCFLVVSIFSFSYNASVCDFILFRVFRFPKYRALSRLKLASACLILSARYGGFNLPIIDVAKDICCTRSQIGRLITR